VPSAISRVLRRNAGGSGEYRPFGEHRQATQRRAPPRLRRIENIGELRYVVAELLAQRWSSQQISRHLRLRSPATADTPVPRDHESICQALYQPGSMSHRQAEPQRPAHPPGQGGHHPIDSKDTTLPRTVTPDRDKIRSRPLTRLSPQQQHDMAPAIKNAHEMALLPHSSRPGQ
jgi:ribosomal protein S18